MSIVLRREADLVDAAPLASGVPRIDADQTEIDVCLVALQALASLALIITNSVLSISVGVMKLTAFTILPSLMLGHLTKPLHAANVALARHAFAPFRNWTTTLSEENTRIIESDIVLKPRGDGKLIFYPNNYKKQALDSLKIISAPISLSLIIAVSALWLAVKPLYLALVIPGKLADFLVWVPMALNAGIGALTYSPLKECSAYMFNAHEKSLDRHSCCLY